MNRKILFILFIAFLFIGCAQIPQTRRITVEIPLHPWEKYSPVKLWYSLSYNSYDGIKTVYVNQDTRLVDVDIPLGKTVFICAYPLGEMQGFGCVVTPQNDQKRFEMTQNDGYLCDIFLNSDLKVSERINYDKLREKIISQCTDFRLVDDQVLLEDALNGQLNMSSIKIRQKIEVPSFVAPSGTWISESVTESRMIFIGNKSDDMLLPVGLHRFYNYEKDLEMRLVVEEDGSLYHHERQALVPR